MSWPPDPRRGRVEDGSLTPAQREWLSKEYWLWRYQDALRLTLAQSKLMLEVEIARGRCLEEDAVFE